MPLPKFARRENRAKIIDIKDKLYIIKIKLNMPIWRKLCHVLSPLIHCKYHRKTQITIEQLSLEEMS